MKDSAIYTENKSEDAYNQLISEDDNELRIEEHPHLGHPDTRHKVVNEPSSQTYRLTAVILGILCTVLMSTIIGLCISYKGLSEKHIVMSQNSSETNRNLEQLKANYDLLTAALVKVQKNFQEEVSAKDSMQIERDRERKRKELLQTQTEALMNEQKNLQADITMKEKSCSRCPVGWVLLQSSCYVFSDTDKVLSWNLGREECKKAGADLAVIDSQEKQEFI
ncbi:C-type lectin domain family 12 member B-like isoform X1 [Conger conger]|uniref:C-type lectin domain family 12 member B-like isoform X1 n=2 Tax=Conger conger TaxID=82655 RepID=UPI002A59B3EF|nr:C-type lectin domain family 12 member B-like isoform X1 [Conger conger]